MSKKLLSVVLALALVVSCFAVSAFAIGGYGYESEEDAAAYTQAWALESTDNGNGTHTVKVKLTANYGVGPIQFTVKKTVNAGTITLSAAAEGEDIPDNWIADVSFSDATGEVAVIPNPDEDGVDALDATDGVYVAELTYTVSSDANGSIVIDVADAKSETNPGGTLIAARMSDGNVVTGTAITGQTVSADTNTITFGSAATPPELAVIDGTIGVIDTSRTDLNADEGTSCDGYLLGIDIDVNGSVSEVFEVVGDGTMNVIANDAGCDYTTGTMVQVLDLDGEVVAEYVVIVFGDVNGDCAIDPTDASIIELHDGWEERVPTYQEFAGDVNADFATDPTDASVIELHDGWEERMDVATILAGFGF